MAEGSNAPARLPYMSPPDAKRSPSLAMVAVSPPSVQEGSGMSVAGLRDAAVSHQEALGRILRRAHKEWQVLRQLGLT